MRGDGPVVVGATVTQQAAQAVRLQEGGGGSPWLFCDGGRIRPTLCRKKTSEENCCRRNARGGLSVRRGHGGTAQGHT